MGKKTKGKKGTFVVQDLHSFNNKDVQNKQEQDFNQKPSNNGGTSDKSKPSKNEQPQQMVEVNRCEEDVSKFQPEDFNINTNFYSMDNKLIDAYYT